MTDQPPADVVDDAPPLTDDDAPYERGLIYQALESQVAAERRATWEADHFAEHETDERAIHWTRANLDDTLNGTSTSEQPDILRRTDGHALLYPGRHHDIHGEPSDGKSWIALAACRDLLLIGRAVIWVDWEDTAHNYVARLRALGVPDTVIGNPNDVAFIVPHGPWGIVEITGLLELAQELDAGLVVFDAMVDALALDGLDENSNADAARWLTSVCRPFNRAGITTLALDHVSKDPATRARGARGGGAKLGFIDGASYATRMVKPFDRNTPGSVKLIIDKDRHGQVGARGKCAAHVHITPADGGTRVTLELRPDDAATDDTGTFMPTVYMERVSRWLEARATEQLSQTAIEHGVGGKAEMVRKALAQLVAHGHLDEAAGPRNARLFSIRDPYRKPDETDTSSDPVPPRPDPVPDVDSRPRPGPASPTGQGRGQPDVETGTRAPHPVPPEPSLDDDEEQPW